SRPLVTTSGESRSTQLCISFHRKPPPVYRCDTRHADDREQSRSSHQNVAETRKLTGEDDHLNLFSIFC
ncbi:hypothetical protein IGI04_008096, partial [Brassica rapa subsp. trilocularis]